MNREIKFRAWNKHNKKMYYKVMVGMWGGKEVMDDENYTACMLYEYPNEHSNDNPKIGEWLHFEPYDDIELMQYTGHKDKNGKEIYEGDIVKFFEYKVIDNITLPEEIVTINDIRVGCDTLRPSQYMEIIGNIYENPEFLLK